RSRLGRRIPYVLAGAPLWAVFAVLIFTPPTDSGAAVTAVYVFFILELFFLFGTIAGGPYDALLPELAQTSSDGGSLQAYKVYLGVVGTAVGLEGSTFLNDAVGFRWMAIVLVGVGLIWLDVGLAG